ncbi:MAG: M48 family metallopeptidase [Lachnospiraceae bacterium]|nr:M48 family metallopeptidase [Lachnospiraceae bacterium]
MNYKLWIIVLFIVVFLYRFVLNLLKLRSTHNEIPENVADIYDAPTYKKWCAYRTEKCRIAIASSLAALVVDIALIATDAYAAFAGLFPDTVFCQLFAVLLLSTLTEIVTLPFTYADTMKIEERYGFNRTKHGTFFADQLKEYLITLGILTSVTWILALLYRWLGDWMIAAFAGVLTVLILGITFLYPLLSRAFNKFTPLPEGELRDKLTALLTKHGYHVRAIEVMDASRRSTKANAYFAGFGKSKSIVLYDTLLEKLTPNEICAVFAHELGHGVHRDTLKTQVTSVLQMVILSVLAWLTIRTGSLFPAFGFTGVNYGFAVLLILSVEFALVAPLYGIAANALSRRHEYRADRFATREGYGAELISGLKKLVKTDFGDVAPSSALILLDYNHPSLSQRITAIEREMQK